MARRARRIAQCRVCIEQVLSVHLRCEWLAREKIPGSTGAAAGTVIAKLRR
jgi:hypothetical protein